MKDAILEIINSHIMWKSQIDFREKLAEETASMMQKFIEWLITVDYNYQTISNEKPHSWWYVGGDKFNLNEIFYYWHTEIYKKERK